MKQNPSDYYIKLGFSRAVSSGVSDFSFLVKELRRTLKEIKMVKERKARLRRDYYEALIKLRLDLDRFSMQLPHHEAEMLKKRLKDIEKLQPKRKKKTVKKDSKKKSIFSKEKSESFEALESERRELELLKKDLEDIGKELKSRK